jgi:hypothetical protein
MAAPCELVEVAAADAVDRALDTPPQRERLHGGRASPRSSLMHSPMLV